MSSSLFPGESILNILYSERDLGIWGIGLDIQSPCSRRKYRVCRNFAAYIVGRRVKKGSLMTDMLFYLDAMRLNSFFFRSRFTRRYCKYALFLSIFSGCKIDNNPNAQLLRYAPTQFANQFDCCCGPAPSS